jgi:hypothetical protein
MSKTLQYFKNLWLFLAGFVWCFTKIGSGISYKDKWNALSFVILIYWWDYGLAVLLGRGVQSLSRAFKLLGENHWLRTGPILWGSVDLWAAE